MQSRKLIKLLELNGYERVSSKGSHHKLRRGNRTVIVPHPKKDLSKGLVEAILKQADLKDRST